MSKTSRPKLQAVSPPSEPTSSSTSTTASRPWKPHGPTSLPEPSHPNFLTFLQETAHQTMYAAEMMMDEHGEIAAQFMAEGRNPPYTLRDVIFKMTAMSIGAELLMMIAQQKARDAAPTLFHPDGRPL
jgi:hypothetical protein